LPNTILTAALDALASRKDLTSEQMAAVLAEIMGGNASDTQTAAVLIALRTKGETVDELVGLASTMRRFAAPVTTGRDDLIDTAGTGGGLNSNITGITGDYPPFNAIKEFGSEYRCIAFDLRNAPPGQSSGRGLEARCVRSSSA